MIASIVLNLQSIEPGLTLAWLDLMKPIGEFLGFTNDPTTWSEDEETELKRLVNEGMHQLAYPPVLPGERAMHGWSWLHPTTTLAIVADTEDYDLPSNIGAVEGTFTFEPTEGYPPIRQRSEGEIRALRQGGTNSSRPLYVAIRPKAPTGTSGARLEVLFWPIPDGSYTLSYKGTLLLDQVTETAPYPPCGVMHSRALLESCLSVAEQEKNDERGLHWERFMERLMSSVAADRGLMTPERLGYNADPGILPIYDPAARLRGFRDVTYEGVLYD